MLLYFVVAVFGGYEAPKIGGFYTIISKVSQRSQRLSLKKRFYLTWLLDTSYNHDV